MSDINSENGLWIGSRVLATILALGAACYFYTQRTAPIETPEEFIERQIRIIERKCPVNGNPITGKAKLEARTIPNRRLKTTFGIDNAFTTDDELWARTFRKTTVKTMRNALIANQPGTGANTKSWTVLAEKISRISEHIFEVADNSINLAQTSQFLTLKVSLMYLFGLDEDKLDGKDDEILFIAEKINELWVHSKGPGSEGSKGSIIGKFKKLVWNNSSSSSSDESIPAWENQTEMHEILHDLTGLDPTNPRDNPMTLILPAYETMWRAVFRGLLEIHFRNAPNAREWETRLTDFLYSPDSTAAWMSDVNGDDNENENAIYALDVVKEILRLYPPTRRIYRQYPGRKSLHHADLERMHRNELLAPVDPETFRPERWAEIRNAYLQDQEQDLKDTTSTMATKMMRLKDYEENTLGFIPFAKVCPSGKKETGEFGFKMIALLVASLVVGLRRWEDQQGGVWWVVLRDSDDDGDVNVDVDGIPPLGETLKSGRDEYLSLVYEVIETA